MNIVARDFAGRYGTPGVQPTQDECQALLHLGDSLAARMPQAQNVLRPWRAAVAALQNGDLEPHAFEAELDRLGLALRRICLGLAHQASDRALRSPRDGERSARSDA